MEVVLILRDLIRRDCTKLGRNANFFYAQFVYLSKAKSTFDPLFCNGGDGWDLVKPLLMAY